MKIKGFSFILFTIIEFIGGWQVNAQSPVMSLSVKKHTSLVNDWALTTDSTRLISVSDDKTLKIWSYPSFDLLSTIHMPDNGGENGQLSHCAIHPNKHIAVVSGKTGTKRPNARISDTGIYSFYIVDLQQQRIVDKIGAFDTPVSSLNFSPNGEFLTASSDAEDAAIYRSDNMEFLCNFYLEDENIYSTGFINDSLLYILTDYRIRFYSVTKDRGKGLQVKMLAKERLKKLGKLKMWQNEGYLGIGDYVFYYDSNHTKIFRRKRNEADHSKPTLKISNNSVQYRNFYADYKTVNTELNSQRVFNISPKGDSISIGFVGEPLYCFKFWPYQVSRLKTQRIEDKLNEIDFSVYHESFETWLWKRGLGFNSPKGGLVYAQLGQIIRSDSHGTFFERFLPVPALEIAQWSNSDYFVGLLADGTIRWFDIENGDEILTLYISPEGEWLMWCPEGYYYATSPDVGKNLECCRQNYLQVETMQPYDMRRLFYQRTEIEKRIRWIFGGPKEGPSSDNWLNEHFMDRDYPIIKITSVKPLTENKEILYSVQFDFKNPNPLKYGYLQLSLTVDSVSYPLRNVSYSGAGGSFLVSLPPKTGFFLLTLSREDGEYLYSDDYLFPENKQYNRCRALLAGVSRYNIPGFPSLSSSRNDVTDLRFALSQSKIQGGERIVINDLLDQQVTTFNMNNQIENLALTSTERDISFFYFSGHGIQYKNKYYLVPWGLQQMDDISHLGIEAEDLVMRLKKIKGLKIIVVDACSSGSLLKYSCDEIAFFTSSLPDTNSIDGDRFSTSLFTRTFINSLNSHAWRNKELTLKELGELIKEEMSSKVQRPDFIIPPRVENLTWLIH